MIAAPNDMGLDLNDSHANILKILNNISIGGNIGHTIHNIHTMLQYTYNATIHILCYNIHM